MKERRYVIEYGRPVPPPYIFDWPSAVGSAAVGLIVFLTMTLVLRKFSAIFSDFKMQLSQLTQVMLSVSRWCVADFGWIGLLMAGIIIPFLVPLARNLMPPTRRSIRWTIRIALFVLAIYAFMLVMSMGLPLICLVKTVSSTGR